MEKTKMFKAIKDNKIIAINDSGKFPCLVHDRVEEDTEHTIFDYMQVNGEYVLTSSDEAIEQRKEQVRTVRNQYLKQTDKFLLVDYPITSTQKTKYKQYRAYLRDYPDSSEDWFKHEPMIFDEWSTSQTTS